MKGRKRVVGDPAEPDRLRTGAESALLAGSDVGELTEEERQEAVQKGAAFAAKIGPSPTLLISGNFAEQADETQLAENLLRDSCLRVFKYPPLEGQDELDIKPERTVNVLLDSKGGMLDSAFKIVMYLSRYAKELNVYVPRRAKSASTLVALGADHVYMSAFAELGPLDTQILDPRNPAQTISALDCYQSVDYVREFGFGTMGRILDRLVKQAGGQIVLQELLTAASEFALGSITPILQGVKALDFGGWGRSLKIGERYAEILLQDRNDEAGKIASDLVYGYTHHPFPIDYVEGRRLGLPVALMDGAVYDLAIAVIDTCDGKPFIGFVSEKEAQLDAAGTQQAAGSQAPRGRKTTHPKSTHNGQGGDPEEEGKPLTTHSPKKAKAEAGLE